MWKETTGSGLDEETGCLGRRQSPQTTATSLHEGLVTPPSSPNSVLITVELLEDK